MRMTYLGSRARTGGSGVVAPVPHPVATFAPMSGDGTPREGPDQ